MRFPILVAVLLIATVGRLSAQEAERPETSTAEENVQVYWVTFAQYDRGSALAEEQTVEELLDAIARGDSTAAGDVSQTIRLSMMNDTETIAEFGRRSRVTTAIVNNGRSGTTRQTELVQTGTSVRVRVNPLGNKIAAQIRFDSTQWDAEKEDDEFSDTHTTQLHTTLLLDPGKPMLLGGIADDTSKYVVVTITPQRK